MLYHGEGGLGCVCVQEVCVFVTKAGGDDGEQYFYDVPRISFKRIY